MNVAQVESNDFDWHELELEDLRNRQNSRFSKFNPIEQGYSQELVQSYENTLERATHEPVKGSVVPARVITVSEKFATLDISFRESAYLDLKKEKPEYVDYIKVGEEITVKILNDKSEKDHYTASFSEAVNAVKEQEIHNSIGKDCAYLGKVIELVSGGYIVKIDEIETFMPGSLAGVNKLHDFSVLLNKDIYVMPINYERNMIVVSHREYLKTLIPDALEDLKSKLNQEITGFVTGSTKYGVFCEFNGCLTGMILAGDLTDEMKDLHSNNKIKPGDEISFYVKEIVNKKKIILTQSPVIDPWENIHEKYPIVPTVTKGRVMAIKKYGAFIEIDEGIIGLLHKNEYQDKNIEEGTNIDVTINRIDKSTKKIFLSL